MSELKEILNIPTAAEVVATLNGGDEVQLIWRPCSSLESLMANAVIKTCERAGATRVYDVETEADRVVVFKKPAALCTVQTGEVTP